MKSNRFSLSLKTKQQQISIFLLMSLLLGSFFNLSGQTPKEIDSLIEVAHDSYEKLDYEQTLQQSKQIIQQSKAIGYEKGMVKAYLEIASCLSLLGEFKKSIEYIEKAKAYEDYLAENPYDRFYLNFTSADAHYYAGLTSVAKQEYREAKSYIANEPYNFEKRQALGHLNSAFYQMYTEKKQYDSAQYHLKQAQKHILDEAYDGKDAWVDKVILKIYVADLMIDQAKIDSAQYYYQQSLDMIGDKELYYKSYALDGLSAVNDSLGNYEKAIEYRLQALEIAKQAKVGIDIQYQYYELKQLYGKIGDEQMESKYLELYSDLSDSLWLATDTEREQLLDIIIDEKESELANIKKKNYKTVLFIITLALICFLLIYKLLQNQRKKKEAMLREKEAELSKNQSVLQEKHEETKALQKKINQAFEEVVQLAKENDPSFLPRFEEVYPEFTKNLYEKHPDLTSAERVFCAMIYLNFSSKEIANYTFIAHRSVQTKRSRLRKKMDLDSKADVYHYLKRFSDS